MAKNVTVYFSGTVGSRIVRVDNDELTFVKTKAVAKDVGPGIHYLQWFGEATPGAQYEIRIDGPPEAVWKPGKKKKANPGGLFGGSKVFRVNQS